MDGDELAHLLESEHGTPFDTPRMVDDVAALLVADDEYAEGEEKPTHNVKKPEGKVDRVLLMPGEADGNTETNRQAIGGAVEVQRTDTALTAAAHRNRVDAADAHLEGDWQQDDDVSWSITHARLLYMISIYARESPFAHEDEREPWIKELHLMVLIYESIQGALLPFNKSPQWMQAVNKNGKTQKIWLNFAQEGTGFINDLCKRGYLHVLRVITEDGWTEIAYRCSKAGEEFVNLMPQKMKTQMDRIVRDPISGMPFSVIIDDTHVYLRSESGFERQCTVTEIGKIPYVTSPYMATCLRHSDTLFKDNSDLGYQCVLWESEVPDDRDEAVVLANVSVNLCEWLFTGPNSIGLMIEALEGSVFSVRERNYITFTSRQAGGVIATTLTKKASNSTETKTRSALIDFESSIDLNFEGKILQAFEQSVKKVQEFGVHINQNGVVVAGLTIDAMQDREWDDIAPNLLAVVLVDLHHDSSVILDPMMSKLQRDILSCLYDGSDASRTKTLCIIVDKIEPQLKAAEYMDGGRYQKEFVQLVGEVHTCRDLVNL